MSRFCMKTIGIVMFLAGTAFADVPMQFSVQGVLRDNTGKLQSMTLPMIARFYSDVTTGTQYGADYDLGMVPVVNGLFTISKPAPSIISDLNAATSVWLEVEINSERYPRQLVTPELYSLMCHQADTVGPSATISVAQVTGALSGDLSGPVPSPTVARINGIGISANPASSGQALVYNGTQYAPKSVLSGCIGYYEFPTNDVALGTARTVQGSSCATITGDPNAFLVGGGCGCAAGNLIYAYPTVSVGAGNTFNPSTSVFLCGCSASGGAQVISICCH